MVNVRHGAISERAREREATAIRLRQGGMTYREIGLHLGVSPQRAMQIEAKGRRVVRMLALKEAEIRTEIERLKLQQELAMQKIKLEYECHKADIELRECVLIHTVAEY